MLYLEIEASIGRSLKKAKGEEKKEKEEKKKKKEENKYFLAFRRKAKIFGQAYCTTHTQMKTFNTFMPLDSHGSIRHAYQWNTE